MPLDHFRTLGPSGLRVSPLTLGTMTFGDPTWGADDETSHAIIDRYLAAGGNALDMANMYTAGRSEELVGSYLARHPGLRDRLVLTTKFGANMVPSDPNAGGNGRKAILGALEASLRRIGTDYVDVYMVHNQDRHTPIQETMLVLDELVRSGKVRYVGLSNIPAWMVAQICTAAALRERTGPIALQVEYSLLSRTIEGGQLGAAREFGLGLTTWSPLAHGALSGKYSRERSSLETSGRGAVLPAFMTERTFAVLDVLQRISADTGSSVAALALAWVRRQPQVTSTIVGARTLAQLDDNLASLDAELDGAQLAELDALTTPDLEYPLTGIAAVPSGFTQGTTTVNDVPPRAGLM
jgi:aryl-alcohol dehydrogenase-like predicted oxidoreductase